MEITRDLWRTTRADIKMGICGEHGGEPSSVKFATARPELRELQSLPGTDREARRRAGRPRVGEEDWIL